MLLALQLFAADPPSSDAPPFATFIPLLLILPVLYFLMIRPVRKQEQERQAMAGSLQKNDKVITSAGIIGTVVSVADKEDEVVIKVDDNVRLRMLKSSITRNVTKEEAAKQSKEQKPAGA